MVHRKAGPTSMTLRNIDCNCLKAFDSTVKAELHTRESFIALGRSDMDSFIVYLAELVRTRSTPYRVVTRRGFISFGRYIPNLCSSISA